VIDQKRSGSLVPAANAAAATEYT